MPASKGKILVMDDEELVRLVAGEMLKYHGYDVEFAKDGKEAIGMCAEALKQNKPFHAAILDLSIPGGMGGKEAIKQLIQLDPTIRVLASSGNANDPVIVDFEKYGFADVVMKPYQIEELGGQIEKAMDAKDISSTKCI